MKVRCWLALNKNCNGWESQIAAYGSWNFLICCLDIDFSAFDCWCFFLESVLLCTSNTSDCFTVRDCKHLGHILKAHRYIKVFVQKTNIPEIHKYISAWNMPALYSHSAVSLRQQIDKDITVFFQCSNLSYMTGLSGPAFTKNFAMPNIR